MNRYPGIILLGCLLPWLLTAADPVLTDHDAGRLVWAKSGGKNMFMTFQETDPSGKYYCTQLGTSKGALFRPAEVTLLPFHKDVPSETVSFYAIYYMSLLKSNLVYAELAQYYPGRRSDIVRSMISATGNQMKELLRLNGERISAEAQSRRGSLTGASGGSNPMVIENDILTKVEDGEPIQLIMSAIVSKDFFLAVGLYEYYCNQLQPLIRVSAGSSLAENLNKYITLNREGMMKEFRTQRQAVTSVRETEFARLCLHNFGVWKINLPTSYSELLQMYDQSFKSYLKLDQVSANVEFPEWGSAMLDVLLMLPDCQEAEPLEKEFDQAFERYKTRIKK